MGTRIVVMKDGVIQQVDTPQNLFDHPANKFVATFIGTPQMNIIRAKLTPREGKMYAVFGENAVRIPDLTVKRLKSDIYIGKDVYLGIRPENLSDEAEFVAENSLYSFEAKVDMTELMGSVTYLYFNVNGVEGNLVASVDPRTKTQAGQTLRVAMDPARLHLFDAETEEKILFDE